MKRSLRQLLVAGALAISAAAAVVTAAAAPLAQPGRTDYDGNGVTDARDLVAFVSQWVVDAGLSATPTATPVASTATVTASTTPSPTVAPSPTLTAAATATAPPTPTPSATPQPPLARRMVVVVLENRNLADVQANAYFASLAARGKLLTNYLTIANPSQPNYVALNFGSTMGVTDNSVIDIPGRNIVDLLEEAGVSWRTYHEHYPGNCWPGYRTGGASGIAYARKHNAFISADTVRLDPARCAKIVDHNAFEADVAAGTVPRYSVFVPDKDNSSHDTDIAFAANWLQGWLEPKLANPTLSDVIWVITWDEGEDNGPVPISTIIIGDGVPLGSVDNTRYDHYALLKTTQALFGLGSLGRNDATAPVIPLFDLPQSTPIATFLPIVSSTASGTATRTTTPTPTITPTPSPAPATATDTTGGQMAYEDGMVLLDNYDRADGGLGSNYTTDALNDGAAAPRVVSNQFAAASGGGYSSARYNVRTWSGNKKAYVSMPVLPESPRYMSLGFVKNPGASSTGYIVEYRVGTGVRLFRVNNTGLDITVLGSAVAWSPSAGDKLGIRINEKAGQIEAWTYSSGAWSMLFDEADTTHTGEMYPFIYPRGNSTRGDDLYVGSDPELVDMIDSGGVIAFAR